MKKISLKEGEAVPFVITKTILERPPSIRRQSRFRGFRRGLERLAYSAGISIIAALEDAFFDKTPDIDDGKVLDQKHYAVNINTKGEQPTLEVEEIPWQPAAGHHYEIVRVRSSADSNPATRNTHPAYQTKEQTHNARNYILAALDHETSPGDIPAPTPSIQGPLGFDPSQSLDLDAHQ